MTAFKIASRDEAKTTANSDDFDLNDSSYYDDGENYLVDTRTNRIVYSDRYNADCPEDMLLCRGLGVFVDLLNAEATSIPTAG